MAMLNYRKYGGIGLEVPEKASLCTRPQLAHTPSAGLHAFGGGVLESRRNRSTWLNSYLLLLPASGKATSLTLLRGPVP